MSDVVAKKTFGRNAVYGVRRNIPFTIKINEPIDKALKEETQRRIQLNPEITDPREQFKAAQLGYEILNDWFLNKSIGNDQVKNVADMALKESYLKLKEQNQILLEENKTLINPDNYQDLLNDHNILLRKLESAERLIESLQRTTENGQFVLQLQTAKSEIERLNIENKSLKNTIREIGISIQNVSGYFYNKAFSELKTKIITILTNI
ncbi:hypothetical protein [Emticicia sp. W12TSBA100-4]|uniref:hypothetical protein n=1 Tax=Emticicia sp. W12TSBA100-4 TaxID=3160965 RepID=UPI0033067AD4